MYCFLFRQLVINNCSLWYKYVYFADNKKQAHHKTIVKNMSQSIGLHYLLSVVKNATYFNCN